VHGRGEPRRGAAGMRLVARGVDSGPVTRDADAWEGTILLEPCGLGYLAVGQAKFGKATTSFSTWGYSASISSCKAMVLLIAVTIRQ
jgi:hypothetical protein